MEEPGDLEVAYRMEIKEVSCGCEKRVVVVGGWWVGRLGKEAGTF